MKPTEPRFAAPLCAGASGRSKKISVQTRSARRPRSIKPGANCAEVTRLSPDKTELYERIYESRFRRLREQFPAEPTRGKK